MVDITATTSLSQNGMTVTDFSAENVEYMIDDCLDTVNLMFEQTMDALSGGAGSKSVTVTRGQAPVVKMLISLVLRENKKTQLTNSSSTGSSTGTSSSIGVGSINVSESGSVSSSISAAASINNPANSVYVNLFMEAGRKLKNQTASLAFCVGTAET
jgi:activator of HSP90 ATPase